MSRPSERNAMPLVALLLGSFGVHLLLWPLGDEVLDMTWNHRPLPDTSGAMEVALLEPDELEEPELDPDAPPPAESPGKLVQLDRVDEERAPDRETPYVSEFDSRTNSPTRAPNVRPQPGARSQPRGDDGQHGQTDSPNPLEPHALPLMPTRDEQPGDENTEADERGELPAPGARVPLPSAAGSPGTRKALREALGNPGSFDDVDSKVPDGEETTLDSKRWKFASFFNRVRNGVSQQWHPETLHASNDPDGRKYGTKTRRTRLIISLNPDGSLNRVRMEGSSDVDYLDEEAIRAVRAAAPFANPPPGLVDPRTGLIEFAFGFIFEFEGQNRIFRYQR